MRTVFVSRDVGALARASASLESQAAALAKSDASAIRRGAGASLESFALVGEPEQVADQVAGYRERFGMTHLIARAQIPGVEDGDLESSLELLSGLV
jgi:alkanesulfonate monooxygenase SsuD/methylene tetrahydromethanopterin reductase-like flavin-dependent oxidoreductase (luciferase family)